MVRNARAEDLPHIKGMISAAKFELAKYPLDENHWLVYEDRYGRIRACLMVAMCRPFAWVDGQVGERPYSGRLWIELCRRLRRQGVYGIIGYAKTDNQVMNNLAEREGCDKFDGEYHIFVRKIKNGRRDSI